jgi:ribosomal protein S18 acetylase RimI-like enzyme
MVRLPFNRLLAHSLDVELVYLYLLERAGLPVPTLDACFEARFLSPTEVERFARRARSPLSRELAERAGRGLDLCYAAIHGDRLASFGWYALHSVEAEHGAGIALALAPDMAYAYDGFTHPDYRGLRLQRVCLRRALEALGAHGVNRIVAAARWSDATGLRSLDELGFRRLGLVTGGPSGPTRVPPKIRQLGLRVGPDAEPALASRLMLAEALTQH